MRHILVVEDNNATRISLSQLLKGAGFRVTATGTAEDALEMWDPSINIALLDLQLPGKWGDELALEIQKHSPTTQIVFITAESLVPEELARRVPGCHTLSKPCNISALLELLEA